MIDVCFEAPLEPKPKARPRVVRGGKLTFTPTPTKRWEAALALAAQPHMPRAMIDEPLCVDLLFVMKRPKRLMRRADPDGFVWAPTRPDADNIRKASLDALSPFWRDDSLVVAGTTLKVFAEKTGRPRVVVRIRSAGSVDDRLRALDIPM